MILDRADVERLGVAEGSALGFEEAPKPDGAGVGLRVLRVAGEPRFELSHWCGTCPFLFERLPAEGKLPVPESAFAERLRTGLPAIDREVVESFARLLPEGEYIPILLDVTPQLVEPGGERDYFAHEQLDTYWGPAQDPQTPYYRTFEAPVGEEAHLYEFVVPMVPPSWNDPLGVESYADRDSSGLLPTAVAVSILDVTAPAMDQGADWYWHWTLTHFLLDGHHKFEAAARAGAPVRLLSLVATRDGLSTPDEVSTALNVRNKAASARRARRA
ncbi:hypothetical protein [Agromyces sp. GXQ0307]|uniref:hypothetical protein n=1 Tax=Agromyces sp. GXQ0307 TaxID=3377835 RepID=UPI00383BEBF4